MLLSLSTFSMILRFILCPYIYVKLDCLPRKEVYWLVNVWISEEIVRIGWFRVVFRIFCLVGLGTVLEFFIFLMFVLWWCLVCHRFFLHFFKIINGSCSVDQFEVGNSVCVELLLLSCEMCIWFSGSELFLLF